MNVSGMTVNGKYEAARHVKADKGVHTSTLTNTRVPLGPDENKMTLPFRSDQALHVKQGMYKANI